MLTIPAQERRKINPSCRNVADEVLVIKIDTAVRHTKKADWYGDRFKEREISFAIAEEIKGYAVTVADVMKLVKAQKEYR